MRGTNISNFDIYAFADYSGAASIYLQRRSIALSIIKNSDNARFSSKGFTRESLRTEIEALLSHATTAKKRVLFGFDHSYSFPAGFYETVTSVKWRSWDQLLKLLCCGTDELPPVNDSPREWAGICNRLISEKTCLTCGGPFWGPNFRFQIKDPKFPYHSTLLNEKRLTEERCRSTKPIFKLGGIGSVGLQSLFGIQHIAKLRHFCRKNRIELFCWPFDGWDIPTEGHLMVEIYPALFNSGIKGDIEDATACSIWLRDQDCEDTLPDYFRPELTPREKERASLEGWIVGVK